MTQSDLWAEKYRPTNLNEMIGNQMKIKTIDDWIKKFKDSKSKKILLISGPPGVGKTTLAHIILKKYTYHPIEFNSSDIRGSKNIKETIGRILDYRSVLDMFHHGKLPNAIIMDEIDTLCSGGDKGGMAEFLTIVKKKIKDGNSIENPIICTYNDFSDKK